MSKPIFLAFCLLGLRFPDFLHASDDASTRAADRIEEIRKRHALPGLMVGYFTSAGEFYLKVCGVRRIGTDDRLQADDPMHLGSCTKSMTATLIGILVDEGKLRWDSTLGEIFPEDEVIQKSEWSTITVDQLLDHTSGVPKNPFDLSRVAPLYLMNSVSWQALSVQEQRRKMVEYLAQMPASEKPPPYNYSNLGYIILGAIIEKIRGYTWEVEIEEKIFTPLELTTAGFGPPSKDKPTAPFGHVKMGATTVETEYDNEAVMGPAGTVHMSMADWVTYLRLHVLPDGTSSPKPGSPAFLSPLKIQKRTLQHLHTPKEGANMPAVGR